MQYDPTVYTVDITVTENDAEHRLDAAVTWRDNAYDAEKGLTFTNTYVEPKGLSQHQKRRSTSLITRLRRPIWTPTPILLLSRLQMAVATSLELSLVRDSRDPNHTSVTFDSDGKATF